MTLKECLKSYDKPLNENKIDNKIRESEEEYRKNHLEEIKYDFFEIMTSIEDEELIDAAISYVRQQGVDNIKEVTKCNKKSIRIEKTSGETRYISRNPKNQIVSIVSPGLKY